MSQWLQALATFSGRLFRRFYTMELKGLLQYIVTRLKQIGGNLELCVLSRLIEDGAGIESPQDTNTSLLSGGRVLKRRSPIISFSFSRRTHTHTHTRSSRFSLNSLNNTKHPNRYDKHYQTYCTCQA